MSLGFVSLGLLIGQGVVQIIVGEITIEMEPIVEIVSTEKNGMSITMFKGDTRDQPFLIQDSNGDPIDLSVAELRFTVKRGEFDPIADKLFQLKNTAAGGSASEIEMTDPTNGKFTVHISKENTEPAEGNIKYWYDIEMIIGTAKRTAVKNQILIRQDITN